MPTVRPVKIDEYDNLGIDENNKLYWRGEPIVTEERVTLNWWLNASAIAAAASGVVLAAIEVLRYCAELNGGTP